MALPWPMRNITSAMEPENRHILLTPPGVGAIAVVRLIGPRVGGFLRRHFSRPVSSTPSPPIHGELRDGGEVVDDVVVVAGDGFADISAHGGAWVVHCIADLARRFGFEQSNDPADGGDGDDVIDREIAAALPLARTELAITALLAQRQAWSYLAPEDLPRMLADQSLRNLLYPPQVAIIGVPNVGKSTLANQLFAQERSITADLPGTTRDWVGELANIDGLTVMLVDTPGWRHSDDSLEQEAIRRSRFIVAAADLVLLLMDPTQDWRPQDQLLQEFPGAVVLVNKTDRPAGWVWSDPGREALRISATTGAGIDAVRLSIRRHFHVEAYDCSLPRCWTDRQHCEIRRRVNAMECDVSD